MMICLETTSNANFSKRKRKTRARFFLSGSKSGNSGHSPVLVGHGGRKSKPIKKSSQATVSSR